MKTLIILILDESGSMGGKRSDVIGGFNSFIADQKRIKTDIDIARLYLVKFNTIVTTVHSGIPLADVPDLSTLNYTPGGNTALYDAIAEAVRIADKDKTEEERVICVIMTDGEENSSRETTKEQVKNIITGHEARGDWTFLYIGENPDKWARDAGICPSHGITYERRTPFISYERAGNAVNEFRRGISRQTTSGLFDRSESK